MARSLLAAVAILAIGIWAGGLVALGAVAAPVVFGMVPAPTSADAMTVVFRRFDRVAVACVMVALLVEAVFAAMRDRKITRVDVARGACTVAAACCAIGMGMFVSPRIEGLHRGGAIRGLGAAGQELDAIHRIAERVGKLELALAVAIIVLHVIALSGGEARNPISPGRVQDPH